MDSAYNRTILDSVASMSNVLKRLKYVIDRKSIETIYFSFIRPKLEYASHIWDNCSKRDSDLLEKFQLDIARLLTGARKGTSHQALYRETNWQLLANRRKTAKLKSIMKMENHECPEYLESLLPAKIGSVRPTSRSADNFIIPKSRTETFKRSFIPSSIKLYNELNHDKRNYGHLKETNRSKSCELYNFGNRNNKHMCYVLLMHLNSFLIFLILKFVLVYLKDTCI